MLISYPRIALSISCIFQLFTFYAGGVVHHCSPSMQVEWFQGFFQLQLLPFHFLTLRQNGMAKWSPSLNSRGRLS